MAAPATNPQPARPRPARARRWRRLFPAWLMIALQVVCFLLCNDSIIEWRLRPWWTKLGWLAIGVTGTVVYFLLLGVLLRRRRRLLAAVNVVSVGVFLLLFLYHWQAGAPLDLNALIENVGYLAFAESYTVIKARVSWTAPALFLAVVLGVVALAFKTRLLSRPLWRRPGFARPAVLAVGFLGLLCSQASAHNELTCLLRSTYDYFFGPLRTVQTADLAEFPYLKRAQPAAAPTNQPASRPHVFIVMLESFNNNLVGRVNETGQEYTPFVNSLRSRGLCVERFYGNSIQTRRGQTAVLCSILPSIRRELSDRLSAVRTRPLSAIMKDAGYRTAFFQAYGDLNFDNTGKFMDYLSFDVVEAMDHRFVTPEEQAAMWSWGLQDNLFYRKFFDYLDREQVGQPDGQPVFAVLATIAHHMPFCYVPADQRRLYPEQTTPEQKFANSQCLADDYLREFFAQLHSRPRFNDSIVIVTGDHSYPNGEHANYHNDRLCFEESFRIPFIMIWPGHVAPRVIPDIAYSQLDIAPTLLDLLNIRVDNHFLGRSMLAPTREQRPIHLVQPYDGTWMSVVIWPMKYVFHARTRDEYLFDLAADPHEDRNLIDQRRDDPLLARLKREMQAILLNQQLIEQNRIWPGK